MVLQEIKAESKDSEPVKLEGKECASVPTYETHWATIFINELKSIKSLDLVGKAANLLEKLVWSIVFISGILWAAYFLVNEFKSWQDNPSIISNINMKLSEIPNPAITFCSQSSTKFAIAEQLGNYLNPSKNLSNEFLEIRNMFTKYLAKEYLGSDCGPIGCEVSYLYVKSKLIMFTTIFLFSKDIHHTVKIETPYLDFQDRINPD